MQGVKYASKEATEVKLVIPDFKVMIYTVSEALKCVFLVLVTAK